MIVPPPRRATSLALAFTALLLCACGSRASRVDGAVVRAAAADAVSPRTTAREDDALPSAAQLRRLFRAIEPSRDAPSGHVVLGRRLFHDPRLSSNGRVSCASCHVPVHAGAEIRARSVGVSGREGARNAPSVFYAAHAVMQFWDGRAETLEAQVDGPLEHPDEMGSRWSDVLARLAAEPAYAEAFAGLYSDGITAANVRDAIARYERALAVPARFDAFLAGDASALTVEERAGLAAFVRAGCPACHRGAGVGGGSLQRLGLVEPYYPRFGAEARADTGRHRVTGREDDRFVFRVPSLRNVTRTPPYFHDGSVPSLREAIERMARHQVGYPLTEQERDAIERFLSALEAEPPLAEAPEG